MKMKVQDMLHLPHPPEKGGSTVEPTSPLERPRNIGEKNAEYASVLGLAFEIEA